MLLEAKWVSTDQQHRGYGIGTKPDFKKGRVFLWLDFITFENKFTTKLKAMKHSANIYQIIFAALLILKIGEVSTYADFSWFLIISPLIIGTINSYFLRALEATGITKKTKEALLEMYVAAVKRRVTNRELKKLLKEQITK